MKMIEGTFHDLESAAAFMGLSKIGVRRLNHSHHISTQIGGAALYDNDVLSAVKDDMGNYMSQSDVARMYGISRQAVHQAFIKWEFFPNAPNPYSFGQESYDRAKVQEFAAKVGWTQADG